MGMTVQIAELTAEMAEKLRADPSEAYELVFGGVDLDKMWHAVIVIFNGSTATGEPVFVGEQFGGDDEAPPVFIASPQDVERVAESLAGIELDELTSRFDPELLERLDIYPNIWAKPAEYDIGLDVATLAFQVKTLYTKAASNHSYVASAIL